MTRAPREAKTRDIMVKPLQDTVMETLRASGCEVQEPPKTLPEALETLERHLIGIAYEKAGHVKMETARLLGIKVSALYYKLEKYGFIQREPQPESDRTAEPNRG